MKNYSELTGKQKTGLICAVGTVAVVVIAAMAYSVTKLTKTILHPNYTGEIDS